MRNRAPILTDSRIQVSYIIAIIFLITINAQAQFSLSPSTTFVQNSNFNALDYDGITIANNSPKPLTMNWKLISLDTISGCRFDLCASGECYIGIPASGTYIYPIPFGQSGWLKMHFFTGNTIGTSIAKIYLYESGFPNSGDTLTFILNVNPNGIISNSMVNDIVSVYPNPTIDKISISSFLNKQYVMDVYNPLGQKIMQNISNDFISLEGFQAGNYFIVLQDKRGDRIVRIIHKISP